MLFVLLSATAIGVMVIKNAANRPAQGPNFFSLIKQT